MKTITLHEPWASFIAEPLKTIETRRHAAFKGLVGQRIAIHAGKQYDLEALDVAADCLGLEGEKRRAFSRRFAKSACPRGAVVCTAFVFAAEWLRQEDFTFPLAKATLCPWQGSFGLLLHEVKKLDPPVPARGRQGVWNWQGQTNEPAPQKQLF